MFNRLFVIAIVASFNAYAGSIGSPGGCKSLKGSARSACESCVAGGNFYQPGQGCGMVAGMHTSKAAKVEKPPPRPTAMPKTPGGYVTVPAGSYVIGARAEDDDSDNKERFDVTITITRPFLMKATEVTQGEWYFIMGSPLWTYDKKCGLDCPATGVSWVQATQYLNALSKKEGLEQCYTLKGELPQWPKGLDCKGYRLPTDVEWEFAARGGSAEPRYGELKDIAWYSDNSNSSPHPVGKKQKNAYGLHDILGNVWEWVWDQEVWKPYSEDMTDPVFGAEGLTELGQDRIIRGGSYSDSKSYVRASHRFQNPAANASDNHGFRPVRTAPTK